MRVLILQIRKQPERLQSSLKVIFHYVVRPRFEPASLCNSIVHTLNPSTSSSKYNYHYSCKPLSKQKSEEELKDKNQLLEAVNKQLHQKLIETQVRDPPDLCHQLPWWCVWTPEGPHQVVLKAGRKDTGLVLFPRNGMGLTCLHVHPNRESWRTWLKK